MQDFSITSRGSTFLLSGELDMETVPTLRSAMARAVTLGGPITMDFSGVQFMDSTGCHLLVTAARDVPSGCLLLHGVSTEVLRVLDVSGLLDVKGIHVMPCDVPV